MKFRDFLQVIALSLLLALVFSASLAVRCGEAAASEEAAGPAVWPGRGALTLVLDPGHGGEDGGAVSVTGTYESALNLAIAQKAAALAGLFGYPAVMTRDSDKIAYPDEANTTHRRKVADQKGRVALVNSTPGAVLISIHQNKYTSSAPSGAQVFFAATEGSRAFGEFIQGQLAAGLGSAGGRSAAKIPGSIYLMSRVKCPAILVECGFVSNEREARLLEDQEYQLRLAAIISGGFAAYAPQLAGGGGGTNES